MPALTVALICSVSEALSKKNAPPGEAVQGARKAGQGRPGGPGLVRHRQLEPATSYAPGQVTWFRGFQAAGEWGVARSSRHKSTE